MEKGSNAYLTTVGEREKELAQLGERAAPGPPGQGRGQRLHRVEYRLSPRRRLRLRPARQGRRQADPSGVRLVGTRRAQRVAPAQPDRRRRQQPGDDRRELRWPGWRGL